LILLIVVIIVLSSGSGNSNQQLGLGKGEDTSVQPPAQSGGPHFPSGIPRFSPAPQALKLAGSMSLPQQVAQLFMVTLNGNGQAAVGSLSGQNWGGVVFTSSNFVTDGQVGALAADVTNAEHGSGQVPPLIAAVQAGGPETAFPDLPPESEATIGSTGQTTLAYDQAQLAAKKLESLNFNMTLAPLADVDIPDGALTGRLFSTDPNVVARMSRAAVGGYNAAHIVSAAGHFPGTGAASADPDQMTATVGGALAQLENRDLLPFAAVVSQAPVIMMSNASYAAFDGVTPAGLLPAAVQLLRRQYDYPGVVMSDDLDATLQATGAGPGTVAVEALQAGDDLLYISGPPSEHAAAYNGVLAAATRSAAVRALVHEALLRDLSLKTRFGVLG
jgi:beta-N-acetylhexosaminidase